MANDFRDFNQSFKDPIRHPSTSRRAGHAKGLAKVAPGARPFISHIAAIAFNIQCLGAQIKTMTSVAQLTKYDTSTSTMKLCHTLLADHYPFLSNNDLPP